MEEFLEVESPRIGLVIDDASVCVLLESHLDRAFGGIDVDVLLGEVSGWPGSYDDLDGLSFSGHFMNELI